MATTRVGPEILRVGWFKGLPTGTVCAFRVGTTLIDTGCPNQWKKVKAFIHKTGVERVLLSHHHEDHAGNANRIIDELPQVPVYAAPETIPYLVQGFPIQLYRQIFWGVPRAKCTPQVAPDAVPTGEGDYLKLIATPGHSTDHHVILAPDRGWLFSSDLYITRRPELFRLDEDPVTEMASLRQILAFDFDHLYCSHRAYVPDGRQCLRDRLSHLEEVQLQVEDLLQKGYSLRAITNQILGREDPKALLFTTGLFRKSHLIEHFARHYWEKQAESKAR